MAKLFLFPHQDDEFGAFPLLEEYCAAGEEVTCIFLTCSPGGHTTTAIRNSESARVLRRLGVHDSRVIFAGESLQLLDCCLGRKMETLANWLDQFLRDHAEIDEIFVPAWEGGHPDHDATHAVAVTVGTRLHPGVNIWQFPLYNGFALTGPFFRVCSPIPENGPTIAKGIAVKQRLKFLALCLHYHSQWRSWLGLWPFLALHYLCVGNMSLQGTTASRLQQPPHAGKLYYERRGFARWDTFRRDISDFIQAWKPETISIASSATRGSVGG